MKNKFNPYRRGFLVISVLGLVSLLTGAVDNPALIFSSTFDQVIQTDERIKGFEVFGAVEGWGVTNKRSMSAPNTAYVAVDFRKDEFGVGFVTLPFAEPLNLEGATLKVALSASVDLSKAALGIAGFRLMDADGTVVRTANGDLFPLSLKFVYHSQQASDLTAVDVQGEISGLDLTKIVSVGILFFNNENINQEFTIWIDDLEVR